MFAEDEAGLLLATATAPDELERMVRQRVRGIPLEQILGWAEFGGLRIAVAPGVFCRHPSSSHRSSLPFSAQASGDAPIPAPRA